MVDRRWFRLAVAATTFASAGCATGSVGRSWFVSGPSGESVVVTVSSPGGVWLRRHRLEDGALLASTLVDLKWGGKRTLDCTPSVPGRFWCLENGSSLRDGDGLRVRDTESLAIVAEQKQMLGGTPELAGEPILRAGTVDPKTRGFKFESRDGYFWIIDPVTLVPSRIEGPIKEDTKPGFRSRSTCISVKLGPYCYGFDNTEKKRRPLERNGEPIHPEHTYLEPALGPQVEGWERVLVVEQVVDQPATLWCLFPDGSVDWKVPNWGSGVGSVKLYRDTVVFTGARTLVALRQRDGVVVWTAPP